MAAEAWHYVRTLAARRDAATGGGGPVKMSAFSGEQLAQVSNPDPFAVPVWRSPVYRTPGWIIAAVQLARRPGGLIRFLVRHPLPTLTAAVPGAGRVRARLARPGLLAGGVVAVLAAWRWRWRASFTRFVVVPARGRWRRWHYRRRWAAVMTIATPRRQLPGPAAAARPGQGHLHRRITDRVLTGIVSGQSPDDFADRADNLAHGFGALLCRVRIGPARGGSCWSSSAATPWPPSSPPSRSPPR